MKNIIRFTITLIATCAVGLANAAVMHIHDSTGTLATIDTTNGNVTVIGNLGVTMTDIAFDPTGNLYGISFGSLYSIDPATAATTFIGSHGIGAGNALVFSTSGTLYAAGVADSILYSVNVNTGASTALGDTGFSSGGDLAFVNGNLYLASSSSALISIDLGNLANSSAVGAFGISDVFGIASPGNGTLFGVGGTTIFQVDLQTGQALNAIDFSGQGLNEAYGQSFFQEAVVPVPAALPLFASALGFMALFRRRLGLNSSAR